MAYVIITVDEVQDLLICWCCLCSSDPRPESLELSHNKSWEEADLIPGTNSSDLLISRDSVQPDTPLNKLAEILSCCWVCCCPRCCAREWWFNWCWTLLWSVCWWKWLWWWWWWILARFVKLLLCERIDKELDVVVVVFTCWVLEFVADLLLRKFVLAVDADVVIVVAAAAVVGALILSVTK